MRRRPNQCAQHDRLPPKVSLELTTRQEAIPKALQRQVMEIYWRCQNRLDERGRKLAARGKTRQKVQIAMARELSAFVWEVMRAVMPKADGTQAWMTAGSKPPAENLLKHCLSPTVKVWGESDYIFCYPHNERLRISTISDLH